MQRLGIPMQCTSLAALVTVLIAPALAGEGSSADISGSGCDNLCPLATTANAHRAYGLEAVQASKVVRAEVAALVVANLQRV